MNKEITLYSQIGYNLINQGLSDKELGVYIALKSLYNHNMEEMAISLQTVYYQLYNKMCDDSHKMDFIKKALEKLNDFKVLKIIDKKSSNYLIDMTNLNQQTTLFKEVDDINPFTDEYCGIKKVGIENYYCTISYTDLQNSFLDSGKRFEIFRYFMCFLYLKSQNLDNYYFREGRYSLKSICVLNQRTIDKYNNILEKNHIIYIHKSQYKWVNTGKQLTNTYGLYKDKDIIIGKCEKIIKERPDLVFLSDLKYNKGKDTKAFKEEIALKKAKKEEREQQQEITYKRGFGTKKENRPIKPYRPQFTEEQERIWKKIEKSMQNSKNAEYKTLKKVDSEIPF